MPKIRDLANQIERYQQCLMQRKVPAIIEHFQRGLRLYAEWRQVEIEIQKTRQTINQLSKDYFRSKNPELAEQSKQLGVDIQELEQRSRNISGEIASIETILPNWLDPNVPLGSGDALEQPITYSGTPKVWEQHRDQFTQLYPDVQPEVTPVQPLDHSALVGTYVDQEAGGRVAGTRFYYELDELVILDMAISMYTMEFFKNLGYGAKLMITPYLMRKSVEEKVTYVETFEDAIFELKNDELLLIPSSEHSIVAYYEDKIFGPDELPIRITAWSPCFRREAGAHGRESHGIFRVKQFHKVEIHALLAEGDDLAEIDAITRDIQMFLDSLGLPNRSVVVPSADMDKRAFKQIDVQTWMPGQGKYRETHSIATLGTWVSEKLKIRYRDSEKKKEQVRNVYATAGAVQRLICAITENYYHHEQRRIVIPDALRKYCMGVDSIPMSNVS